MKYNTTVIQLSATFAAFAAVAALDAAAPAALNMHVRNVNFIYFSYNKFI